MLRSYLPSYAFGNIFQYVKRGLGLDNQCVLLFMRYLKRKNENDEFTSCMLLKVPNH